MTLEQQFSQLGPIGAMTLEEWREGLVRQVWREGISHEEFFGKVTNYETHRVLETVFSEDQIEAWLRAQLDAFKQAHPELTLEVALNLKISS